MKRTMQKSKRRLFENLPEGGEETVVRAARENLPEPVQKYVQFARLIGREKIQTVHLSQKGIFRTGMKQKGFGFRAEQFNRISPPSFVWYVRMKPLPFFTVHALDQFLRGRGNLQVRISRLKTVVDARGGEIDQGELLRFLAEMVWYPTAFLEDFVTWEARDAVSAKATIRLGELSVSGVFHFDREGRIVRFTGKRYREVKGKYLLDDWITEMYEYREIDGIMIPGKGRAIWKLAVGDFCYFEGEIVKITFNSIYSSQSDPSE